MALDINARSRVAKHVFAIHDQFLFLLLGREEMFLAAAAVHGGRPRPVSTRPGGAKQQQR
jgi:hypothetical protein